MNLVEYELMMNLLIPFAIVTSALSIVMVLAFINSNTFTAIDKRFASCISGAGKVRRTKNEFSCRRQSTGE